MIIRLTATNTILNGNATNGGTSVTDKKSLATMLKAAIRTE